MCILTELGMIVKPFLKFSWREERNILLRTGNFAYFACFCRGIVDNFLFPVDRSCDILNFCPAKSNAARREEKRRGLEKKICLPCARGGGRRGTSLTEGLFRTHNLNLYNPPASLRSAPSLTQGGLGKERLLTPYTGRAGARNDTAPPQIFCVENFHP